MNIQEFARSLGRRSYRNEITGEELHMLKELGYVVVFGASDDLMELEGAINDEFGCYDGGIAYINKDGLIPECEDGCKCYRKAIEKSSEIKAIWCGKESDGWTWTYETDFPHATFEIYDDEEKYCLGIVFDLNNI